ncbi:hypothetical protein KP509_25G012400 [Ceratopteris richardii]|uniref:EF-hand domain-containing protein n=1 Tax=Ceratopteris richardii TaxID=49495 RepID=A0A8T2RMW7_CERRI|nr:hypothetical protein KP509_25G012400 [Ceratopteris richardii]
MEFTPFKDLQLIAQLHYEKAAEGSAMRLNRKQKVTLEQLLNTKFAESFRHEVLERIFKGLDDKRKGYLNFNECVTFQYLCMYSNRICAGCKRNIAQGQGYSCYKCWKEVPSDIDNDKLFTVCYDCFCNRNFHHHHHHLHLLHDFVLFDNLLSKRSLAPSGKEATPPTTNSLEQAVRQCIVCGDHHESRAQGFLRSRHMDQMQYSSNFVCEWCSSSFCSKCGRTNEDNLELACFGKWLQRSICYNCRTLSDTKDVTDNMLQRCKTCKIKQSNGTLLLALNGTNIASMLEHSSSYHRT